MNRSERKTLQKVKCLKHFNQYIRKVQFSLITITLNAQQFLKETLESVCAQVFKDFEHLIWDGGSTDETLQIVRSFPHVKLQIGKDRGIADAMNQCAAYACGKFLLFLHADDILAHPKSLLYLNAFIAQRPFAKWIYGRSAEMELDRKKITCANYRPFCSKKLLKYNCLSHPSTIISKDLFFEANGYQPHLKYCMDYDLWLRLSSMTEAVAYPGEVGVFRKHPGSLSTKEQRGVAYEAYKVRNRYISSMLGKVRSYRTLKRRLKSISN